MNSMEEKFVLLSAYLDGEVTPAEQAEVEAWLQGDSQAYQLYQQQLRLRRAVQALPVPHATSADVLVQQVLGQIERQQRQQQKRMVGIGGLVTLLAVVVGGLAMIDHNNRLAPSLTQATVPATSPQREEPLMIALETPIVPLPNAVGE